MLADKRNKIRRQLRAQELGRRFAIQRKALLQGSHAIFSELDKQMRTLSGGGEYDFTCKLLSTVQSFPEEENSYILVHLWLTSHPEYYEYFELFITAAPRFFDSYVWCLHYQLHMYLEHRGGSSGALDERLRGIALILGEIGREAMGGSLEKLAGMMDDYILIAKRLIDVGFGIEELLESLQFSLQCIGKINPEQCQPEQLSYYMDFLTSVKEADRWEFIVNYHLEAPFTTAFSNIAFSSLKNVPQIRIDCVKLMEYLLSRQKDTHLLEHLPLSTIVGELLYLLKELPDLKESILILFRLMLEEASRNELSLLLEFQLHVKLTQGMDFAMQQRNNQLLQKCLSGIFSLLNKLNLTEQKLLRLVKEDIQGADFHLMIEGLLHQEQNPVIEGLVSHIVDDFYSQEVSEAV